MVKNGSTGRPLTWSSHIWVPISLKVAKSATKHGTPVWFVKHWKSDGTWGNCPAVIYRPPNHTANWDKRDNSSKVCFFICPEFIKLFFSVIKTKKLSKPVIFKCFCLCQNTDWRSANWNLFSPLLKCQFQFRKMNCLLAKFQLLAKLQLLARVQLLVADHQLVVTRPQSLECPAGIAWGAGSDPGSMGLKSGGTKSRLGIDSQTGLLDTGSSPPQEKI